MIIQVAAQALNMAYMEKMATQQIHVQLQQLQLQTRLPVPVPVSIPSVKTRSAIYLNPPD